MNEKNKICSNCIHFRIAVGEDYGACAIGVADGIVFDEDECPAEHWFTPIGESAIDYDL